MTAELGPATCTCTFSALPSVISAEYSDPRTYPASRPRFKPHTQHRGAGRRHRLAVSS